MADEGNRPIIVIKKKGGGHAAAHGGAWKVAYADFVTAMMCFFLVMWLMGADEETKAQIASYFNNPNQVYKGSDSVNRDGQLAGGDASTRNDGSSGRYEESQLTNPSHSVPVYIEEQTILNDIATVFPYEGSAFSRDTEADILKFVVPGQVYFSPGSANITSDNHPYLNKIGAVLKNYKGSIVIEGHSEKEEVQPGGTDPWVLAFGRAMSVRNYLIQNANISPDKLIPTVSYFSKIDPSIEKKIKHGRFVNFILKHSRN